jgi:hypothetical protein
MVQQVVILVNDSEQAIEAYDVWTRCWIGDKQKGASGTDYDTLTRDGDFEQTPSADGGGIEKRRTVIPAGDQRSAMTFRPEPPECQWKPDVDAVLYADGTYGGDFQAAQGLQARRDGIVASVRDWVKIFDQPGQLYPQSATSDQKVAAIEAEAQRRKELDIVQKACLDPHTVCAYRFGRSFMDGYVATLAKNTNQPPEQTLQRVTQLIARINKKIENDRSLPILDAVFPPLPPSLADLNNQPSPAN